MSAAGIEPEPAAADVDLSSREFWELPAGERDAGFAALRRERPLSWHRVPIGATKLPPNMTDGGFWAVVRHADVRRVSRDPGTFCNHGGTMFETTAPGSLEGIQSFFATDPPRHTKLRGIVASAFTPRRVRAIEAGVAGGARGTPRRGRGARGGGLRPR